MYIRLNTNKKKFKVICFAMAIFLIFIANNSVLANTYNNNEVEIKFKDFSFTIDGYNKEDIILDYNSSDESEIVKIIDKNTGETLEILENKPHTILESNNIYQNNYLANGNTTAHSFTRTQKVGTTTLKFTIIVEIYNSGSFRQINSIQSKYLGISTAFTPMSIEDKSVSAWPQNNKYPATVIHYGYSGTLVAQIDGNISISSALKLLGTGFEYSGTVGGTAFYRRSFSNTGKINIYGGYR